MSAPSLPNLATGSKDHPEGPGVFRVDDGLGVKALGPTHKVSPRTLNLSQTFRNRELPLRSVSVTSPSPEPN
eukprot:746860-Hanusia_phi.AAC.1